MAGSQIHVCPRRTGGVNLGGRGVQGAQLCLSEGLRPAGSEVAGEEGVKGAQRVPRPWAGALGL